MAPVTIYTTSYCVYCWRAKSLLEKRGVPFTEVDVTGNDEKRAWLVETTGRKTVPQIFIAEKPVGGFDDLAGLAKSGELDRLLGT